MAMNERMKKINEYEPIGNFFRLYSVLMIPLASLVPSAVALYWASSGLAGLAVTLALVSPKVRKLVRMPEVEKVKSTPYVDLANNIKTRWCKILKINKE